MIKSVSRNAKGRPGKYEGEPFYTEGLYTLSLEGYGDCETGDVDTLGWHAVKLTTDKAGDLLRSLMDHPDTFTLRPQDRAELVRAVGAILDTDSQGFVTAKLYTSRDALDADWARLESTAEEQAREAEQDSDDDMSDGLGTYEAGTL